MSGNVWEWCWDWHGSYSSSVQTDPKGTDSGSYRVNRGGSWNYYVSFLRPAYRSNGYPYYRYGDFGFRVLRTK